MDFFSYLDMSSIVTFDCHAKQICNFKHNHMALCTMKFAEVYRKTVSTG